MDKLGCTVVVSVVLAAIIYYRKDVDPGVLPEDVWWGHEVQRNATQDVRPFQINVTDEVIRDLKQRLTNFRRPAIPLTDVNFEYGFNSDHLMKIIDHWAARYNWTERQAYLNSVPQYKTNIYGLDVHFLHARPQMSAGGDDVRTVPLLMLHGWPGSVVEFYKIIPLLTRRRGSDDFAFEVIAPSLPGYGFSDAAVKPGMGPAQMGQMFVKLMERLGHRKFYVQGGDWGAAVTDAISILFPDRVYGMHSNMCSMLTYLTLCDYTRLALGTFWPSLVVSSEAEKTKIYPLSELFSFTLEETGYMHIQMTKPDTAGVALDDSPAGLAAYILEKFSTGTNKNFKYLPDGGLTTTYDIDELLDNVMIYWLSRSMTTSMRLYSEFATSKYRALPYLKAKVKVPAACALFPYELAITFPLKKLLPRKYQNLISATEMKEGGHFAAFEKPKLLAEDIWSSVYEMENIRNNVL